MKLFSSTQLQNYVASARMHVMRDKILPFQQRNLITFLEGMIKCFIAGRSSLSSEERFWKRLVRTISWFIALKWRRIKKTLNFHYTI